jgi:hypothetical protein
MWFALARLQHHGFACADVQWQGQTAAEATWEPLEQFKEVYPEFQLEDELFRQGGGSVMDFFFHRQYMRRRKPTKDQGAISGLVSIS